MNYPEPVDETIKRDILKEAGTKYGIDLFIETGTAEGFTVDHIKDSYKEIISIEIEWDKYFESSMKFINSPNVKLIHGDCETVLYNLCPLIKRPGIFWLDAHYNGGKVGPGGKCPVKTELFNIFYSGIPHVILVDDIRLFGVDSAYPDMEDLISHIAFITNAHEMKYEFEVENDILLAKPKV